MSLTARAPGPIGAGAAFRENPLAFLRSIDEGQGVISFRGGLSRFYVVREPEAIHRVLVGEADRFGEGKWTRRGERVMGDCLITREGEPHHERRRVLQPGFDRRKIEPDAEAITRRALELGERWREGEPVEARAEMARLALAAAAAVLFSLELDDRSEALVPALLTMLAEIPRPGPPLRSGRRLDRARAVVDRELPEPPPDGPGGCTGREELISLLIAAIDTTPGTLAWCWYLLAEHPQIHKRLVAELDSVLGERAPTAGDLPSLPFLGNVLSEVLRLYPPVHFIDRRPLTDVEIDGCPIGAGAYILLSPLLTQRDERFFTEPDRFAPERWEDETSHPRYSYFPFGGGPHTCIGMYLARTELALVIATLARDWSLVPARQFPDRPTPNLGSFPMIARRRER